MTAAGAVPRARALQHPARTGLSAFLLALVLALVLGAVPAGAFWPTTGTGFGTGTVDTLGTGAQPTTSAAGTSVTVSWAQTTFRSSPLGGYSGGGYTVLRYPAAGGTAVTPGAGCATTVSGSAATLTCTETGVPPGDWQYTVIPVLNSWTGVQSPTSTTQTVAVGAPTLSSATAQDPATGSSTGAIALSWTAVTGATGYDVFRRTSTASYTYSTPLNGSTPLTGTTYTDPGSGLSGGTSYDYVVRARTSTSTSASSNELSATAVARPAAPATTTATPAAAATVSLSWAAVSGATGYVVFRRTSTGAYNYASPLTTTTSQTTFTDATAVDGTAYRYVVRATGPGAGATPLQSVDGPEASATADGTPPTAVSLTDPGTPLHGPITLNASATGATSATVQYAPTGTSTWSTACTGTSAPFSCTWTPAPSADGVYDLRVVASDAAGNATTSAVVAARRVDNTGPVTVLTDPGAYVRGTLTLNATASDAGTGLSSLVLSYTPTGTSAWGTICTQTVSPANCTVNTTGLANGGYDIRAVATDAVGNTTTVVQTNVIVDNAAPTASSILASNGTGTVGRPDQNDVVSFGFSEPIAMSSISATWTSGTQPVTVRITGGNPDSLTVYDSGNTTMLPLGTVKLTTKNSTSNTFSASSMALSGNTITVTLGTATGTSTTKTTSGSLSWVTAVGPTDRAGNPLTQTTITQTVADVDF